MLHTLLFVLMLGAESVERPALVVQAPDSPVRLDRATVLTASEGPPVLLYSATNLTDDAYDTFTVIVFVFAPNGDLKARQTAPARGNLDRVGTKESTVG